MNLFVEEIQNEKISIIIPIYNVQAYLQRCLNTVCSQSYKNLEIILVDDGSTDNCLQICEELAENDDRIIVIHQTNQGVSVARNTGLDAATGDYIGFVDPDDYIHPEMYERLFSLLKTNDADMSACFGRGCFDSNYAEPPRDDIEVRVYDKVGALKSVFDPKYEINGTGVVVWNRLYKKKLFNNLRFSTQYRRGEDEHIICFLMKRVDKFVITDERLYYYFNRSDSLVHKKSTVDQKKKELMDQVDLYEERLSLLKGDQYTGIFNMCFLNMMNLAISAFFEIDDIKRKKSLVKRYNSHFYEFRKIIVNDLSIKDKIRFFTFRIFPHMYKLILLVSKRKSLQ